MNDLDALKPGARDALFLDFDGTLAEIAPDPEAVFLPDDTLAALARLAGRQAGAVAVISGRDLRDLARRVPDSIWRIGGHGLEVLAPGAPAPREAPAPAADALLAPLRAATGGGVWLEVKGPIAALHFRALPDAEADCLRAARTAAAAVPGHVVQPGKMVVEVKPAAANKGRALRAAMTQPPFAGRRPLMLGDDATDEDAMRAAQDLGGLTVKVGAGPTVAGLRAPDPAAVRAWLARISAD